MWPKLVFAIFYISLKEVGPWALGGRGAPAPSPFSGTKIFFLRKIGVDEREGVDEKSDKK